MRILQAERMRSLQKLTLLTVRKAEHKHRLMQTKRQDIRTFEVVMAVTTSMKIAVFWNEMT